MPEISCGLLDQLSVGKIGIGWHVAPQDVAEARNVLLALLPARHGPASWSEGGPITEPVIGGNVTSWVYS